MIDQGDGLWRRVSQGLANGSGPLLRDAWPTEQRQTHADSHPPGLRCWDRDLGKAVAHVVRCLRHQPTLGPPFPFGHPSMESSPRR